MKVRARDGKTYEVTSAPPGGEHEVYFKKPSWAHSPFSPPRQRSVSAATPMTEILLVDIADRFVAQGGAPMGIA
ncbi:MAG: hypothetical protein R3B70_26230 [Polyangiaceae bacterium]